MNKTYVTKPAEIIPSWHVVDADGQTLGRLASEIAKIIRGKHKPIFSPSVDCGDYVIVINSAKIHVTGRRQLPEFPLGGQCSGPQGNHFR